MMSQCTALKVTICHGHSLKLNFFARKSIVMQMQKQTHTVGSPGKKFLWMRGHRGGKSPSLREQKPKHLPKMADFSGRFKEKAPVSSQQWGPSGCLVAFFPCVKCFIPVEISIFKDPKQISVVLVVISEKPSCLRDFSSSFLSFSLCLSLSLSFFFFCGALIFWRGPWE